ncbi:helix-turn-helix transcriptional regulator [Bradyrhizobium sp. NAS80.1]|uniref:helix-turn-helix transcriptional regulator n=1 Tax=Bradyrhizobium sp. NAS80.1 TaxID=1680159 RepID=UPI0011611443|nr:helix-turn-helix transcriptional regulator [Bradyrhizobium sp. NAS80.1]
MDKISAATGAVGAALIPINTSDRPLGLVVSAGVAELMDRYIKEGWYEHDRRDRGIPRLLSTGITVDQDHTSPEEMRRSRFYNDLLGRCGFRWFAGVAFDAGEDNLYLAIQRSPKQGPFRPAEQRRLLALRPSLTSAATVGRELGFVRALGISDAFEMMETAALLVDRDGRVVSTNKVADKLVGGQLRIVNRHLIADDRNAASALRQLIERAIVNADAGATMMPPVAVARPGRRALAVYAVPLSGVVRDVLAAVRAIVVIRDLEECSMSPEAHVRNLFSLTSAEAKLATRVASGEHLEFAADALGIAYQTARNQMQAIFAKTDTHRQAEIVALFARLQGARPLHGQSA